MRILITAGSRHGGTVGIAETLAAALAEEGFRVELAAPSEVPSLDGYDAVIVGGAIYLGRWHRDARRFVHTHAAALRKRPTYLFSSGPVGTGTSAPASEIPPVPMVRQLMTLVCARGHVTFGGRVSPEGRGALGAAFARRRQGDWRDEEEVRTWAGNVADDLRADARHRAAG